MKNLLSFCSASSLVVPIMLLTSCVKMGDMPAVTTPAQDAINITVPSGFNYKTTEKIAVDISLLTNDGQPLQGVLVNVLDKAADEGGQVLFTAVSDKFGKITSSVTLPAYLTKVIVDASYIGLMRNATVNISGNEVLATIGGPAGYGGNVDVKRYAPAVAAATTSPREEDVNTYVYLGTYSNLGKPNYLVTPNDVISSSLLSYINASLPEGKSVPVYHPTYLSSTAELNINVVQQSDIYVTFVHEGAGYKNTLAYFTYPTNTPPTSLSQISSLKIILPNGSLTGSGGDLASGNKVKLGNFAANTSIGFCLIANGWSDNNKNVGTGLNKFFTIDALNPEPNASLKRHAVLLRDAVNNVYLTGFDDQRRDQESDNDFNDMVFYTTSSVTAAISNVNVNPVDTPGDKDGDGVSDVYDQFPTDPTRAYINYYPSANTYTSVAFEDTWPNTGDYDMNDVIVDQRYKIINNAQNKTVEVFADYVLKASGASFGNGFGVQFPFAPGLVSSVTGSRVTNNTIVSLATNGCENGQAKAVIIPFDDFYNVMPRIGNNYFNTDPVIAYRTPDTIKMKISFGSPITAAQLGTAPYNPFIICHGTRGNEVHLPGELPTDKANTALFNTSRDNTIPAQNRYYKTSTNLPFAIALPQSFEYPIEGKSINILYLKFDQWAQSGGTQYADWYLNTPGYRSSNYFYKP